MTYSTTLGISSAMAGDVVGAVVAEKVEVVVDAISTTLEDEVLMEVEVGLEVTAA